MSHISVWEISSLGGGTILPSTQTIGGIWPKVRIYRSNHSPVQILCAQTLKKNEYIHKARPVFHSAFNIQNLKDCGCFYRSTFVHMCMCVCAFLSDHISKWKLEIGEWKRKGREKKVQIGFSLKKELRMFAEHFHGLFSTTTRYSFSVSLIYRHAEISLDCLRPECDMFFHRWPVVKCKGQTLNRHFEMRLKLRLHCKR